MYVFGVSPRPIDRSLPGPRILRSADGANFEPVPHAKGTLLGDIGAVGFRAAAVYKSRLFVAAGAFWGEGVLLESRDPMQGGNSFCQVLPSNVRVNEMVVFNGWLYLGLRDELHGYSVVKINAEGGPPYKTVPVFRRGGAWGPFRQTTVLALCVFQDRLFVGTDNPAEVIAVDAQDCAELIIGRVRRVAGRLLEPASSLGPGLNYRLNVEFERMEVHGGCLYLSTTNLTGKFRERSFAKKLTGHMGFDLYATADGAAFERITQNGFGDAFGGTIRTFASPRLDFSQGQSARRPALKCSSGARTVDSNQRRRNMARFLFAVWPYDGCIYPDISIAQALVNRGQEVAFYTGSAMEPLISAQGFRFFPLGADLDRRVRELLTTGTGVSKKWRNPLRRPNLLRRFLCDTVPAQVADLDAIYESWHPDAIICEPALYAPFLILYEARDVPVAILEYSFCMLPGPEVPPPLGLPSPRSLMTRLQSSAGELAINIWGRQIRSAASDLRVRYGLPRLSGRIIDLEARLPLILAPSSREFDFNRKDPLPNVHYVGACLWYPPSDEASRLTDLKKTRPWVHVTEGTLWARHPVVLQAAAEGLANLPMEVIIATGPQTRPELDASKLALNITVKRWVSYPDLLPRADVVVSIAGGGTVLGALSHGVPMVLIPLIWDQSDNAQRVVEAGAGIRLSRSECTPRRIRSAVERVLADPSYRQNAQRIARSLQRHGGPEHAAKLIEGLMVSPRGSAAVPGPIAN